MNNVREINFLYIVFSKLVKMETQVTLHLRDSMINIIYIMHYSQSC